MPCTPIDPADLPIADREHRARLTLLGEARQGTRAWRIVRLEELSPQGFRITWFPDASPHLPLRIQIPGMQLLTAQICWQTDATIGCEFREPLHVAVFEHLLRQAVPIT